MDRPTDPTRAARIDHLVLAVPDLEAAVEEIGRAWGCPVYPGGRHPHWGSWNALVPLVGGAYLEVIAPHPEPPEAGIRVFGLDHVTEPVLATWAIRPAGTGPGSAAGLAAALAEAGVEPGGLRAGSRRTPDGHLLEWTLSDPFAPRMDGVVPFLIDWGQTPHPSGAGRPEAALERVLVGHPEQAKLERALGAVGVEGPCRVVPSEAPFLEALLRTPAGPVTLLGPRAGDRGRWWE